MLYRMRAVLAGLWAGMLLTIGLLAAPVLFQMLDKAVAGQVAGRYFFFEAKVSLLVVAALLMIERFVNRGASSVATARMGSGLDLALLLGALASVVVGYEVLHPMMDMARQGQGRWTFGQLHGLSMLLYGVRTTLALVLAWRYSKAQATE